MTILSDIGEKALIQELTSLIQPNKKLIGGLGHDSAFIDEHLSDDEILLFNTDRSGMNIAYKLGLSDGRCVGDFAVSHSVSDILASGGQPISIGIAMLLPATLDISFLKEVMIGINDAAKMYNAFICSGDTKQNNKFALVVSVIGKAKRKEILMRSGAQVGDLILCTGNLGTMQAGWIAFKQKLELNKQYIESLSNAIIYQRPPYVFSRAISSAMLAHACMDNSDGISSTIHEMCVRSNLGANLIKEQFPISDEMRAVAELLKVDPFQFCLSSGDWAHIYAVPKSNVNEIMNLAVKNNTKVSIIGEFTPNLGVTISVRGKKYILPKIENDRFGIGGTSWFDMLSHNINYLGNEIK